MGPRSKIRIPIVVKLASITILLLLMATIPIAFKSSDLFEDVSGKREEDSNREQANARANEVEGLLISYIDKLNVVASLLQTKYPTPEEKEIALTLPFRQDRDLVAIEVYELKEGKPFLVNREVNDEYLKKYDETKEYISSLRTSRRFPLASVFAGNLEIKNSSAGPKLPPLLTVGVPLRRDDYGSVIQIAVGDFGMDRIQKIFGNLSERIIYLVDKNGYLLAHPKQEWTTNGHDMRKFPIVDKALKEKTLRQGQLRFWDPEEHAYYIGSFAKTPVGVSVIAQAAEDIILEPARNVRRQAFFITGLVLSGSLFLIFLFSITLTNPIERLLEVTKEVAKGNFDARADITARDEVGELAKAFDEMTGGLKERDKMKNVLNKFHGSSVTEDLLKGDLSLGGSNKEVTVFFSDIRDFTKFSEGHTPEEVVSMLNEYFGIMVGIINKNHGVVDKFIGDAIMAVWGAPHSTGTDQHNAVQACLEMRKALAELNEVRIGRGQVPIKIGIGIHSGRAISGTIGSSERMEYTVIGDTVNMTSRIESSTKAFGTDLLLSEVTAAIVQDRFILEYAGAAEVKGKSEPLKMYKVRGYIREDGVHEIVQTPYSDYEAGHADKVKVA